MLKCPKCGYDNELGRIFCHQCGTKLDLEEIKPTSRGGKDLRRKRPGVNVGRISWRIFLVALLALIVWGIVLLVQVPVLHPVSSGGQDFFSVNRKQLAFDRSIQQHQQDSVTITEPEVNAFLGKLALEKVEGKGLEVTPSKLQIQFGANEVTVIVIGQLQVGSSFKKEFSVSYTGLPTVEDGRFVFKPTAAAIGALKIPSIILKNSSVIQSYYAQLFRNMTEERRLLDKLSSILVNKEHAVLEYHPAAAPAAQASN
jgi:hypothetical protein